MILLDTASDPCDGWPWRWPSASFPCPAYWAAANHPPVAVPTMEAFEPRDITVDRPQLFAFAVDVWTDRHGWPDSTGWTLESGPDDAPSSIDIVVPYSYRPGTPDSYWQPGDAPELETGTPWFVDEHGWRREVELLPAELERVETWIHENPPEHDFGDDR